MRLALIILILLVTGYISYVCGDHFFISLAPVNFVLEQIFDARTLFTMPADMQMILLTAVPVPVWVLWLIASFVIYFLVKPN